MKQGAELRFTQHAGELVVGAEVGGGEGGEGSGIERRRLAHGGDHLAGAVDDQGGPRVGLSEKAAKDRVNLFGVVFPE